MKNISLKLAIIDKPGPKKPFKARDSFIIFFIFIIVFFNFKQFAPSLFYEVRRIGGLIVKHPNYSYDEKISLRVGKDYYEWTKLVRTLTSQNSLVFHPPQMWPWGQSGNPEFSQYFLFPAKLIREDRGRLLAKRDINYVAITWGDVDYDLRLLGWPKFPVFTQKIYYLPQNRKTEVRGLKNLKESAREADRVINAFYGNWWDITYSSSSYDYWTETVNLPLKPDTNFKIDVKSNWPNSTALIAQVDYGQGREAFFSSSPNKATDKWVSLELNDLYSRAVQFAHLQGWQGYDLKITELGVDTGHPAVMPYMEKWGLMEVETGTKERVDDLEKSVVNQQSLLSLGNISVLNNDMITALNMYQRALLLDPSNPWPHLGIADTASKIGDKQLAFSEYQRAIDADPDDAWFYYALGKAYQDVQDIGKAEEFYQKALDRYPDAPWAHLGLGEVYELDGKLDQAAEQYRLASASPRRDFTSDGQIAWQRLNKIENQQNKIIQEALLKISQDPDDWEERVKLGHAYIVLGKTDKAEEQYKIAYQENASVYTEVMLPPNWTDQLTHSVYGKPGPALNVDLVDDRYVSRLDNYHSYMKFSQEFFPPNNGTVEIKWRLPADYYSGNPNSLNLIYQFKGFAVWLAGSKFNFRIFDQDNKTWQVVDSLPLQLDKNKWYKISLSYGDQGVRLYLDGNKIAESSIYKGMSDKDIYLGRGFLWSVDNPILESGYFDTIAVYGYQK